MKHRLSAFYLNLMDPGRPATVSSVSTHQPCKNDSLGSVIKLKETHEVKKCFKVIR